MYEDFHSLDPIRVVYHKDYGGFNLNRSAIKRILELGWSSREPIPKYVDNDDQMGYWVTSQIKRHDPILLMVADEMGVENIGEHLAIEEIVPGYYIEEYDGKERVRGM